MIKLRHWEYWPFAIVQFPIMMYYLWLACRSRSLVFFSASNPGIVMGGMFGESKFDVLDKVPVLFKPKTIRIKAPASADQVMEAMREHGLSFPVIFKPDVGERGFMVKRIRHAEEAERYVTTFPYDFLVQELVLAPMEFGVFYTRYPQQPNGRVTSVVMKEMLTVTGNGRDTLQTLIWRKDRAKLQWPTLRQTFASRLHEVIPAGHEIELVSIGNHCLGTKFLNGNHLINDMLSATFDHISRQIEGFYFGRFDLRCETLDDLYKGNVKIVELNGCGAEPAHIYHPGYPLREAWADLFRHWQNIFLIARENTRRGIAYTSLRDARQYYRIFKSRTTAQVN